MKKVNLLLLFLLCTPLLFAADIDKVFKKWTKDYPESTTEKWQSHTFTAEENQQIQKEVGITGVKADKAVGFETSSPEVISQMKADMATCTPTKKYVEVLKKSFPNTLDLYVYAHKDGETWKEAFVVVFSLKEGKAVAGNVAGEIPNSLYEQYMPMVQMMLDQAVSQIK